MKTLHFYILRELALPVVLSVAFFTLVLLLAQVLDLANAFLKAGVSGGLLIHLMSIVLGTLLTFTVPMGVLLGTLIGIGRLTNENEVLAIRVSGVSPLRAFMPVLFAGFLISVAQMTLNNAWIPRLYSSVRNIMVEVQFYALTNLEPGRIYDELGNDDAALALTYEKRGPDAKVNPGVLQLPMENVNVRMRVRRTQVLLNETPEPGSTKPNIFEFLVFARKGLIAGDPSSTELTLDLEDGTWIPLPHSESESRRGTTTVIRFDHMHNRIGSRRLDIAAHPLPREMPVSDLHELMTHPPDMEVWKVDNKGRRLHKEWKEYFSARNEMISRFTLPFATFAFVLLAVPLAMEVRSGAKSISTLITIGLLLGYYLLMSVANAIGSNGASWPAAITAHMFPNLLIGLIGASMLWRQMRM